MPAFFSPDFIPTKDWFDKTFFNFDSVDPLYKFRSYIGKGTFSHVFLAYRRGTRNRFAIKRLRRWYVQSRPVPLWKREFDIGHRLCHRNVIQYMEILSAFGGRSPCFVMEYCQNNLCTLVSTTQVSPFMKRKAVYEILKGVEYLHARNVVHHDLKPSNILVDERGTMKIGDFGQALRTKRSKIRHSLTFGTPNYIAIEVLLGQWSVFYRYVRTV